MENIEGQGVVSGPTLPAQIWHDYMTTALENVPPSDFPAPAAPRRPAAVHPGQLERSGIEHAVRGAARSTGQTRPRRRTTTTGTTDHRPDGRDDDRTRRPPATDRGSDAAPRGRRGLCPAARGVPPASVRACRAGTRDRRARARRAGAAPRSTCLRSRARRWTATRVRARDAGRAARRSPSAPPPGDDPPALPRGSAAGITTGGVVPDGADAVVPVERVTERDGIVTLRGRRHEGDHVRAPGSDLLRGSEVLPAGAASSRSHSPR